MQAENVLQLHSEYSDAIFAQNNVVGVGVGEKLVHGVSTGSPALMVFVQKKYSKSDVISKFSAQDVLPESIDGIPVDVMEVGYIVKQYRERVRPVRPGYSCGHKNITAGTIGGFFLDRDGEHVLLGNNHTLADENKARIGDQIYQPGVADAHGTPLEAIGVLKAFIQLSAAGNLQDSAIATVQPQSISAIYPGVERELEDFGTAFTGQAVQKFGRTTEHTTGKVLATNGKFTVGYDFGEAVFEDCIVMTALSQGGDSGSVICDMQMRAVGLLFSGSDKVTLANPIHRVQQHYGLRLLRQSTPAVWAPHVTAGAVIDWSNGVAIIKARANQACYIELPAHGGLHQISCHVHTGTDGGATWGPGIAVQGQGRSLKINVRKGGTFGAYYNGSEHLGGPQIQPNTAYSLRLTFQQQSVLVEGGFGDWHQLLRLPGGSIVPHVIRIGKTDNGGNLSNHSDLGSEGECRISDIILSFE